MDDKFLECVDYAYEKMLEADSKFGFKPDEESITKSFNHMLAEVVSGHIQVCQIVHVIFR